MRILRKAIGVIFGLISLFFILAIFVNEIDFGSDYGLVLIFLSIAVLFGYLSYRSFSKNKRSHKEIDPMQEILENTSLTEETLEELENGTLPVVHTDKLILQPDEVCHYYTNATRLITKNRVIGYSGGSGGASFRIAKGVTLRTGSYKGTPIRGDVTEESPGQLFITNKRLIFVASKNNFQTTLDKITAIELYSDGISLQDNKSNYAMLLVAPEYPYTIIKSLAEAEQAS